MITRPFVTFPELQESQGNSTAATNDLRFRMVSGASIPSVYVSATCARLGVGGNVDASLMGTEASEAVEVLDGLYYLQKPTRVGPLDCKWLLVTVDALPGADSVWWLLPQPVTLDQVLATGVLMADQRAAASSQPAPKGLAPKARKSLMLMVAAMATQGYKYSPTDRRSPVAAEIADDCRAIGGNIDEDTVRRWLRECAAEHVEGTGAMA